MRRLLRLSFFLARRAVGEAEIVVANQDLVLADLTMPRDEDTFGGVILPKPEETLYIFDEAHHVPAKAIDRGAADVHLSVAMRRLGRMQNQIHAAYSLTDKESIGNLTLERGRGKDRRTQRLAGRHERGVRMNWMPSPGEAEPMYRASLGRLPENWVVHATALRMITGDVQKWVRSVRRAVVEMEAGRLAPGSDLPRAGRGAGAPG